MALALTYESAFLMIQKIATKDYRPTKVTLGKIEGI